MEVFPSHPFVKRDPSGKEDEVPREDLGREVVEMAVQVSQ
jgi:hypothetical protein